MTPKTSEQKSNGTAEVETLPQPSQDAPRGHAMTFTDEEVVLLYNMVREGGFPTVDAKVTAASIQQKLEALQPQE